MSGLKKLLVSDPEASSIDSGSKNDNEVDDCDLHDVINNVSDQTTTTFRILRGDAKLQLSKRKFHRQFQLLRCSKKNVNDTVDTF